MNKLCYFYVSKVHLGNVVQHLAQNVFVLQRILNRLCQMIERRVAAQRHRERVDYEHFGLSHGVGHLHKRIPQPAVQMLGQLSYRVHKIGRQRAQHVRYEYLDAELIELVVALFGELDHLGTLAQAHELARAQLLLVVLVVDARRAPEHVPDVLDLGQLERHHEVEYFLALTLVQLLKLFHVLHCAVGRQLKVLEADVAKVGNLRSAAAQEHAV